MFQNKEKIELIAELHAMRMEFSLGKLLKLLNILITETRIENDTVEEASIKFNQGKIDGYAKLKDYIERGLPGDRTLKQ